tara:strand:+ start:264 stop:503 length:240 start_codon:yes stop_codon:yes gene_type:complete
MIDMKKKLNIAIVGLGQIGNYLYNELNIKKKDILKKTGKIISVSAISVRILIKKENLKLIREYFTKILLKFSKIIKLIF